MKKTLKDLINAILGTVVMSMDLERMFDSFLLKRVPELWEKKSYPSLKPLASWVPDFCKRMEFYQQVLI